MALWLLILIALLGAYFVCSYIKPVGNCLSFYCSLVGKPFVMVEQKTNAWSIACYQAFQASHLPELVVVLALTLYFVLAVLFVLGESFNTLLALPALFHTA